MDAMRAGSLTGTVSSRKCPLCGHHEVGVVLGDGSFYPLRPGMTIHLASPEHGFHAGEVPEMGVSPEEPEQVGSRLWVPEPLRGDKVLRKKYGVLVNECLVRGRMSADIYDASFVAKLERLIAGERHIPLPVILDRFFTAPNLASGNPLQIAEAMWQELEEVRKPALLVRQWLEKADPESLSEMIRPKKAGTIGQEHADDEAVMKELNELSLEEFLEML